MYRQDATIIAPITPPGTGAIGVIRLSGPEAIRITNRIFKGKNLEEQATHTLHFGTIVQKKGPNNEERILDEVVISIFKNPRSYTGEDVIEISCHGSPYIIQQIIQACIREGAIMAEPGEFSQRAFLNGKLDLTQAEAVADLIASKSEAAHKAALNSLKGGFRDILQEMRAKLIEFSALIELELDFSQEDVTFADRKQLLDLIFQLETRTDQLIHAFHMGNAIKEGIKIALVGKPNVGKSTLLNSLLQEDRAIVSDIAGTTRDAIEATLTINGVLFLLTDTAGIRSHSDDQIERIGIEKSKKLLEQAEIAVLLLDGREDPDLLESQCQQLLTNSSKKIIALNKTDLMSASEIDQKSALLKTYGTVIPIAAKTGLHLDKLTDQLFREAQAEEFLHEGAVFTNARHVSMLQEVKKSLSDIRKGIDEDLPGDLIALDIRRCLFYLGSITGQVETDRDILGSIFGKFCIGK